MYFSAVKSDAKFTAPVLKRQKWVRWKVIGKCSSVSEPVQTIAHCTFDFQPKAQIIFNVQKGETVKVLRERVFYEMNKHEIRLPQSRKLYHIRILQNQELDPNNQNQDFLPNNQNQVLLPNTDADESKSEITLDSFKEFIDCVNSGKSFQIEVVHESRVNIIPFENIGVDTKRKLQQQTIGETGAHHHSYWNKEELPPPITNTEEYLKYSEEKENLLKGLNKNIFFSGTELLTVDGEFFRNRIIDLESLENSITQMEKKLELGHTPEIVSFRESMARLRREENMPIARLSKEYLEKGFHGELPEQKLIHIPTCLSALPIEVPLIFTVHIRLFDHTTLKAIRISRHHTVRQTIEQLIKETTLRPGESSIKEKPEELTLKLMGKGQYYLPFELVTSKAVVRQSLIGSQQRLVELSLAKISEVHELDKLEPVDETIRALDRYIGPAPPRLPHASVSRVADVTEDHAIPYVSSWEVTERFAVAAVGVDGLNTLWSERLRSLVEEGSWKVGNKAAQAEAEERRRINATKVPEPVNYAKVNECNMCAYLTAYVAFGGKHLHQMVMCTPLVPLSSSIRFGSLLSCSCKVNQIPSQARICFTLHVQPTTKRTNLSLVGKQAVRMITDIPIGWVSCPVFDYRGFLQAGSIQLKLWPDDSANSIGTCNGNIGSSSAPTLVVAFPNYVAPIVFPSELSEEEEIQAFLHAKRRAQDSHNKNSSVSGLNIIHNSRDTQVIPSNLGISSDMIQGGEEDGERGREEMGGEDMIEESQLQADTGKNTLEDADDDSGPDEEEGKGASSSSSFVEEEVVESPELQVKNPKLIKEESDKVFKNYVECHKRVIGEDQERNQIKLKNFDPLPPSDYDKLVTHMFDDFVVASQPCCLPRPRSLDSRAVILMRAGNDYNNQNIAEKEESKEDLAVKEEENNKVIVDESVPLFPCYSPKEPPLVVPDDPPTSFNPDLDPRIVPYLRLPSKEDWNVLKEVMKRDTLAVITPLEQTILYSNRYSLIDYPQALPLYLRSVTWSTRSQVVETHYLLRHWKKLNPVDALELLDAKYADPFVREMAVKWVDAMADEELEPFLLQLVQVLKNELYHDSPLAHLLVKRALHAPNTIGHTFFWHLKAEVHNAYIRERYGLMIQEYMKGCGMHRQSIFDQNTLLNSLLRSSSQVLKHPKEMGKKVLHEELSKEAEELFKDGKRYILPLSPDFEVGRFVVEKCKVMDSKKRPLWMAFENSEEKLSSMLVMFKVGDDIRQDQLTLQVLRVMDQLWKQAGLDLRLSVYGAQATGDNQGFIEVVLDSETMAHIAKGRGGALQVMTKTYMMEWLAEKSHNNPPDLERACKNFAYSCAGYCVATHVIGIGDRHNDNLMCKTDGRMFHIDFGHFLGNFKKKWGFEREKAPFIFTPAFAYVLGDEKGQNYQLFVDLCCKAYNVLRHHASLIMNLFMLMLSTGIPELTVENDILWIQKKLCLGKSDEEAAEHMKKLIKKAKNCTTTQINDLIHVAVH